MTKIILHLTNDKQFRVTVICKQASWDAYKVSLAKSNLKIED